MYVVTKLAKLGFLIVSHIQVPIPGFSETHFSIGFPSRLNSSLIMR